MNRILILVAIHLACWLPVWADGTRIPQPEASAVYNLESFSSGPLTSGSDILVPLTAAFNAIRTAGVPATLNIPAGSYTCPSITTAGPCTAPSNCTVVADGVTVTYPSALSGAPDYPSVVFCQGTDVQNFTWNGGAFSGFNYDTATATNSGWAPKETVCTFDFGSRATGCANINFNQLSGLNTGCMVRVSGINVSGGKVKQWFNDSTISYLDTETPSDGVTLTDCTFSNCGLVMWDYGYLWQIITFQSQYSAALVAMAGQYMDPQSWITNPAGASPKTITFSGTQVQFDNSSGLIPQAATGNSTANDMFLVSFGPGSAGSLPSNIVPGLQYFVVTASAGYIEISQTYNGAPIVFTGSPTAGCDLFYNLGSAYWNMYLPLGANLRYDGAWQFQDCTHVQVQNCTWSSPGDSEVVEACQNTTLEGGSITDAKMGALFFGGSLSTTVKDLACNGGDGSRVLSLEYGDVDTTIEDCDFTGGGRGTLINDARGLAVRGNSFSLNEGKTATNAGPSLPNLSGSFATNRISYTTGNWEQDPVFLVEDDQDANASSNIAITNNAIATQWHGMVVVEMTTTVNGWQFENNTVQAGTAVAEAPPVVEAQPDSETVAPGAPVTLEVAEAGPATFQWYLNGVAVPGATQSTLWVVSANASEVGTYTCILSNLQGSVTTAPVTLAVTTVPAPPGDAAAPSPGRLINLSCRAMVGTGSDALIEGFAIGGTGTTGSEPILVRASGPALAPLGVSGALPDPLLQLHNPEHTIGSNSGWSGAPNLEALFAQVNAFPWPDPSSLDSALAAPLQGGPYTAVVSGASGDTGVALAEVYDATPAGAYTLESPRLVNISARARVGTGANLLIAGIVIGGTTAETVLVRASGPALAPLGVVGALPDPQIEVHSAGGVIASNAGWGADPQIAAAADSVGAFSWGSSATPDSALLLTLSPGAYTIEVSGISGDSGVALIEVYEVR